MLRYDRQLGDIIIAPSYVHQQCLEDKEHYEVSVLILARLFELLDTAVST